MSLETLLHDAADATFRAIGALTPPVLGAFVAQIHERGLGWRDRALAMAGGVCVSYYATLAATVWFRLDPFIAQSVGFVLGMVANKATPRLIENLTAVAVDLPGLLRDRFLPRKDR